MRVGMFLGLFLACTVFAKAKREVTSLSTALTAADIQALADIMAAQRKPGADLEALEKRYNRIVQRQIYGDLVTLYTPENQARLQITYGGFAPEGAEPDADLGYGLHIVKRLEMRL